MVDEIKSLERHGVGEKTVQKLVEAGIGGLAHLLEMSDDEMTAIEGIGPKTAEKIRESATRAKLEWDERDAAEEAERVAAEKAAADEAAADSALAETAAAQAQEGDAAKAPGERAGEEGGTDGER
jgi:NAD-dependent DNA ligase